MTAQLERPVDPDRETLYVAREALRLYRVALGEEPRPEPVKERRQIVVGLTSDLDACMRALARQTPTGVSFIDLTLPIAGNALASRAVEDGVSLRYVGCYDCGQGLYAERIDVLYEGA